MVTGQGRSYMMMPLTNRCTSPLGEMALTIYGEEKGNLGEIPKARNRGFLLTSFKNEVGQGTYGEKKGDVE
ncbi:hypothetical protein VNO77_34042 [Canavalia gladiata]|uniref:Uncharacterized protein n=1 Tax=Canavalia gladiata TaxID=3824 RepID=A0AAN9KDN4_CANGL